VAEGDVAVADLEGQWNENGVVGDLDVIGTDAEEEGRAGENLGGRHERLQILELDDRRSHELGVLVEAVKLLTLVLRTWGRCRAAPGRRRRSGPPSSPVPALHRGSDRRRGRA